MDLLNVVPISDIVQSRGESSRSADLYSPHIPYSPHTLYPSGYLFGVFPDNDNLDILPVGDNRDMRGGL
jgi:hypothetical protein